MWCSHFPGLTIATCKKKMRVKIADGWALVGSCLLRPSSANQRLIAVFWVGKGEREPIGFSREEWATPNMLYRCYLSWWFIFIGLKEMLCKHTS